MYVLVSSSEILYLCPLRTNTVCSQYVPANIFNLLVKIQGTWTKTPLSIYMLQILNLSDWVLAAPKHGVIDINLKLHVVRGYCVRSKHLFNIASTRWESLRQLHFWVVFSVTYVHMQGKWIYWIIQENNRERTWFRHMSLSFV